MYSAKKFCLLFGKRMQIKQSFSPNAMKLPQTPRNLREEANHLRIMHESPRSMSASGV